MEGVRVGPLLSLQGPQACLASSEPSSCLTSLLRVLSTARSLLSHTCPYPPSLPDREAGSTFWASPARPVPPCNVWGSPYPCRCHRSPHSCLSCLCTAPLSHYPHPKGLVFIWEMDGSS